MNCKNVIVAGFNSGANVANHYVTGISEMFNTLNTKGEHKLVVVPA